MAALLSGSYVAKVEREVVVWPAPDVNGDGDEVWENETDNSGNVVGQTRAKDKHGNEIFNYLPPKGFVNKPGYDHTDNYVKVTDRGQVLRDKDGAAICIKPGQALVFNPDNTVEILPDEYAQYLFAKSHDATNTTETAVASSDSPVATPDKGTAEKSLEEQRDDTLRRLVELDAQLASRSV